MRGLFADAYPPETPTTGGASGVGTSAATVSAAVNPDGAAVRVFFEFGTTTAYGQATAVQTTAPTDTATPFAAALSGLPAGTTIHYRAIAISDFSSFAGGDQTLTTASPPLTPPSAPANGKASLSHVKVSGKTASVHISCIGAAGSTSKVTVQLTVAETFKGRKLISVTSRRRVKKKLVVVGTASVTLTAGHTKTVRITLNSTGKRLLAKRHSLKVTLRVAQAVSARQTIAIGTQKVTFKTGKRHR